MEGPSDPIRTELLTIHAADHTPLDGVHYMSAVNTRLISQRTLVNFVHGRSMTFYIGIQRFAAPTLPVPPNG